MRIVDLWARSLPFPLSVRKGAMRDILRDRTRAWPAGRGNQARRRAGQLAGRQQDSGFYLVPPAEAQPAEPVPVQPAEAPEALACPDTVCPDGPTCPDPVCIEERRKRGIESFELMRQSLEAGVQVVSAPQLFPTPAIIAGKILALADIRPGQRVLEPSAGTGALLELLDRKACEVVAVEINLALADALHGPAS